MADGCCAKDEGRSLKTPGRIPGTLGCMPEAALRTLTLQIDPAANPIVGAVRDERGTNRTFSGWIGLAAALEHAINAVPGQPTTKRPSKQCPKRRRK